MKGESLKNNIGCLTQHKKQLMLQKYYYHISKRLDFFFNEIFNCLKSSKMKPCWLNSHKGWREMKIPWLYREAQRLVFTLCLTQKGVTNIRCGNLLEIIYFGKFYEYSE